MKKQSYYLQQQLKIIENLKKQADSDKPAVLDYYAHVEDVIISAKRQCEALEHVYASKMADIHAGLYAGIPSEAGTGTSNTRT